MSAAGALALPLSAFAVGALLALRRRRARGWIFLCVGCLPLLVLLRDEVRIFSFHGLLHSSIVYRVLSVGVPPSDPFLAGGALHYPWGHHALLALVVRGLDVTPPMAFALFNALALAATLAILARIAGALSVQARIVGTALAMFGVSPYFRGPLAEWLPAPELIAFKRILPIEKFLHVTNNQAGYLTFALTLLVVIRIAREERPPTRWVVALAGSTAIGALLYPTLWPPVSAGAGACAIALLWVEGRSALRRSGSIVLGVGVGSALALPYLLPFLVDRTVSDLTFHVVGPHTLWKLAAIVVTLGPVGLLAWGSTDWRSATAERHARLCVATATLTFLGLFLLLDSPLTNYKLLALAALGGGLLAGAPVESLLRRSPWLGAVLLVVVFTPAAAHVLELLTTDLGDPRAVVQHGASLSPAKDGERRMYEWVRRHTAADSVFVDTRTDLPLYGPRALYVMLDPEPERVLAGELKGWSMWPGTIAEQILGHSPKEYRSRVARVKRLLSRGTRPIANADLQALRRGVGAVALYAVTRDRSAARRLSADQRFEVVFHEPPLAIFELCINDAGECRTR